MDVDHEIELLKSAITRLGEDRGDTVVTTYGALFNDDEVANTFEALFGTLKAARRRGLIDFKGELLLAPMHNNVEIALKK